MTCSVCRREYNRRQASWLKYTKRKTDHALNKYFPRNMSVVKTKETPNLSTLPSEQQQHVSVKCEQQLNVTSYKDQSPCALRIAQQNSLK